MKRTDYIVIGAAAAILIAAYMVMKKPFTPESFPGGDETNTEITGETPAGNSEGTSPEIVAQDSAEVSATVPPVSNEIVTGDFRITPPAGWEGRPASEGLLALAIRPGEVVSDEKAAAIGFKSYFAVMRDGLNGKTHEEYVSFIGEEIKKIADPVVLETVWQTRIDGMDATILDISLRQEDIDFKVLMFLIWDGSDVWSISFNTTADKWGSYEDAFFTAGNSFKKIN